MRKITSHQHAGSLNKLLEIGAGEPGPGGDCHEYIVKVPTEGAPTFVAVNFQAGNPADGVNGISMEALLAICADRLNGCQSGPFACPENDKALSHIEMAMFYLSNRALRVEAA